MSDRFIEVLVFLRREVKGLDLNQTRGVNYLESSVTVILTVSILKTAELIKIEVVFLLQCREMYHDIFKYVIILASR